MDRAVNNQGWNEVLALVRYIIDKQDPILRSTKVDERI